MTSKKDHDAVLIGYGLFAISLLLHLYPTGVIGLMALLFVLIFCVYIYYQKNRADAGSFLENHMIYQIRSLWIGSLYLLICIFICFK